MKHPLLILLLLLTTLSAKAQSSAPDTEVVNSEAIVIEEPTPPPPPVAKQPLLPDTTRFVPDPNRSAWLAALAPGLGQIYNRRYWKLPILIGGYMGLIYASSWNTRYYNDYSVAYRDAMDDDPLTKSYENFLPAPLRGKPVDQAWLQSSLKRKKDFYRRNRDLCIISMVGLYLVAIVDAYVDAQLYSFDITPDLTMKITPAIIAPSRIDQAAIGLQAAFCF